MEISRIKAYLRYRFQGLNRHDVHSPFVFALIEEVIRDQGHYAEYDEANALRKLLHSKTELIQVESIGAPSKNPKAAKTVTQWLYEATQQQKYQEFLFRLLRWNGAHRVLELGTCLGLTTFYMDLALQKKGDIHTIEGNKALFKFVGESLPFSGGVNRYFGLFDDVLPKILAEGPSFDLVYIDGNHTYEATLRYFDMIWPHMNPNGVLVFDDINWSTEMQRAWEVIKNRAGGRYVLDLFQLGIVFMQPQLKGQYFSLKY